MLGLLQLDQGCRDVLVGAATDAGHRASGAGAVIRGDDCLIRGVGVEEEGQGEEEHPRMIGADHCRGIVGKR